MTAARLELLILLSSTGWIAPALGLVPHVFWSGRRPRKASVNHRRVPKSQWSMYFDDCERGPFVEDWESWMPELGQRVFLLASRAQEKKKALQRIIGHNVESSAYLSRDQIEDETLQWAVDCNVVWAGDDDEEVEGETGTSDTPNVDKLSIKTKFRYESISDLMVASECQSELDSLAYLWKLIARLLNNRELNSVYMIVFPNAAAMWDYDKVVTLLRAVAISKPLLPSNMQHVQLDLFHPNYKHSPKMWSPEMHSPFPTVGVSIASTPPDKHVVAPRSSQVALDPSPDEELEQTRSKFKALFASIDADDRINSRLMEENWDVDYVLKECKKWAEERKPADISIGTTSWDVDTHNEPFQIFSRLWSHIGSLQSKEKRGETSTMLVVPNLDAHTTQRLAITVNAALMRLGSSVRVANVYHPMSTSSHPRHSPHAMIYLKNGTN